MRSILILIAAVAVPLAASAQSIPPLARRVNTVDQFHGTAVPDPYRWMEDLQSNEVKQWAAAQNAVTEAFVGSGVQATYKRLLDYSNVSAITTYYSIGESLFTLRNWAASPRAGLYVQTGSDAPRHLLGLDVENKDAPADWVSGFWPSRDGKRVLATRMSKEVRWGTLQLFDVKTGRVLKSYPGAYTNATAADWLPDGSGYVYSIYRNNKDVPADGKVVLVDRDDAERVLLDRSGETDSGRWTLVPHVAVDSNQIFIEALDGSSGKNEVYFVDPKSGAASRLFEANASWLLLGARDGNAWFYTDDAAPNGRVVRVCDVAGRRIVETVIPEGSGSISANSQVGGNAYGLFGDHIALLYLEEAIPSLRIFDLNGRKTGELEIPPTGSVWGGFSGDPRGSDLYYQFLGISEPSSIYRVNLAKADRELVFAPKSQVKPDEIVARRIFVDGGDGVRVPVLIAHRKGLSLDRPHRTTLYGYGAFGWVSFLWYQPNVLDWMLNDDGVFVVAGVRGGGEFGAAWHEAGKGVRRQTVIDDYIKVARYLIDRRITRPDMLVANGGSLSGSLAGSAMAQHPELFGAVTLDYPALDLIRYPQFGAAKYWAGEIGSPDDPAQFRTLLMVSPYQNIKEGMCYPATLVRTGEHDPVVTPVHGYKFAARLQHAIKCANPVLLDVMEGANHDYGATPEQVAKSHAVMLEFLRRVLPRD